MVPDKMERLVIAGDEFGNRAKFVVARANDDPLDAIEIIPDDREGGVRVERTEEQALVTPIYTGRIAVRQIPNGQPVRCLRLTIGHDLFPPPRLAIRRSLGVSPPPTLIEP